MAILNAETLPKAGPNIELAALPARLEIDEWPGWELYREHVFFEWPDELCSTICFLTHTYLFFDQYDFTQHHTPEQIYSFVAEILNTASRIAACPVRYFNSEIILYEESKVEAQYRTGANLKSDILDTLMFIAEKSIEAARDRKCLAIIGI